MTSTRIDIDVEQSSTTAHVISFPDRRRTIQAVSECIQYGLNPGTIEFVDALSIELINDYRSDVSLPEEPTLILKLHGNNDGIEEDVAFARSICEDYGART